MEDAVVVESSGQARQRNHLATDAKLAWRHDGAVGERPECRKPSAQRDDRSPSSHVCSFDVSSVLLCSTFLASLLIIHRAELRVHDTMTWAEEPGPGTIPEPILTSAG